MNMFQKAISGYIALRLSGEDVRDLNQTFHRVDKDGNGMISIKEFEKCIEKYSEKNNLSKKELKDLYKCIDIDNSGYISYNEFIAATMNKKKVLTREACFEAFKTFDHDKDGKISLEDFEKIVLTNTNSEAEKKELRAIFNEIDEDGSGTIDFEELMGELLDGC